MMFLEKGPSNSLSLDLAWWFWFLGKQRGHCACEKPWTETYCFDLIYWDNLWDNLCWNGLYSKDKTSDKVRKGHSRNDNSESKTANHILHTADLISNKHSIRFPSQIKQIIFTDNLYARDILHHPAEVWCCWTFSNGMVGDLVVKGMCGRHHDHAEAGKLQWSLLLFGRNIYFVY